MAKHANSILFWDIDLPTDPLYSLDRIFYVLLLISNSILANQPWECTSCVYMYKV